VRAVARVEEVSEGLVERSWGGEAQRRRPAVAASRTPRTGRVLRERPGHMWTGMWDLETGQGVAFVPVNRHRYIELSGWETLPPALALHDQKGKGRSRWGT
jgi:hypothetical protein